MKKRGRRWRRISFRDRQPVVASLNNNAPRHRFHSTARPIISIEISNHSVCFVSTFERRRRCAKRVTPKVPARKSLKLCTRLLADNIPISHFTVQIRFLREAPWSLHRTTRLCFTPRKYTLPREGRTCFTESSSRELSTKVEKSKSWTYQKVNKKKHFCFN